MNNLIQMRSDTDKLIQNELQIIKEYESKWEEIYRNNIQQSIERINWFVESNKQNIDIYNSFFKIYSDWLNSNSIG